MTARWGGCLALILALLLGTGARAQPVGAGETMVVARVPIEAQGPDGARARERALAEGRMAAFKLLMERMLLAEDQKRLGTPSAAEVERLLASFGVDEERIGPNRYKALLTVAFAADAVRRLWLERGIPYVVTAARPAVVLPLYWIGSDPQLWDDPNPWRDAWSAEGGLDGPVPVVVPLGDVGDVVAIDVAQAVAGKGEALARIAARYRVEQVLLAEARVPSEPSAGVPVAIALRSLTDDGSPTVEISGRIENGEDPAAAFVRLRAESVAQLEDAWKRAHLVRGDNAASLEVTAAVGALADWTALRARLAGVALIERVALQSLARDRVRLVLHHHGDARQLAAALHQANLELTADGAGWRLGPAAAAGPRLP